MTEFDSVLKRAFAETPEPADDGFSAHVSARVLRREHLALAYTIMVYVGAVVAGFAALFGLFSLGEEFLANAGLELARAYGSLSGSALSLAWPAEGMLQTLSVGAGMTQVLLVTAALAGGAVAYRSVQD